MNLAQARSPDWKYKLPQKQYPIYKPTLNESWINVRNIKGKTPVQSAGLSDYIVNREKILIELAEKPMKTGDIRKACGFSLDVTNIVLAKMLKNNLVTRESAPSRDGRAQKTWLYSIKEGSNAPDNVHPI